MEIYYHQAPYINSVFHIPASLYNGADSFEFIGTPTIHDHIILNEHCAVITFEIDGIKYKFDGDVVCGKFVNVPKIRIDFDDPCQKLTIIRLNPCGLYRLTDSSIESLIDKIAPLSILNEELQERDDIEEYLKVLDRLIEKKEMEASFQRMRSILRYIHMNFAYLPRNASKDIAERFGVSESTLRRYFKQYIGVTLSTYIVTIKRKKMIEAVFDDKYDSMVVRQNGYYDQSHFLNDFKRLYGISLKHYFNELQLLKNDIPELMRFLYHCDLEQVE